jgi:hypothetical protein
VNFTRTDIDLLVRLLRARSAILPPDVVAQRDALGLGSSATLDVDADALLAANSDSRIATQKAVKSYVAQAVTGLLDFKGSTDASTNPNYPVASKGDAYVISVAGKIGGAAGTVVAVGDVYVASADNAGGDQAAVGTSWFVLEHNLVGTNTGDETAATIGALINGATGKATPVDADALGLMDSADSNVLKKLTWANVKATLKTYFDSLYAPIRGAGGAVVQATSKATGVTLDTACGQITLDAAALAAGAVVSFTLVNSTIGAHDSITVHRKSGGTAEAYDVWVDEVAAGSCVIAVRNTTAGSLSEAVLLQFSVTAGSIA